LWDIYSEFVGWRVHARVIAGTAIVTKVRQVEDVSFCKVPPYLNGLKYWAIAFAIAASVADHQLAVGLIKNLKLGHD
jgi:hypothetical protein